MYVLQVHILLLGLLPYVVYIMAAWMRRDALLSILGALLVLSEVWVMGRLNIQPYALISDKVLYLWSALSTGVLVLTVWVAARLRKWQDGEGGTNA